jgi:hypothetical protein
MSVELIQTLVNALLLLLVAFIGGTLGLRRFEAIERSIADLRTELRSDIAELRSGQAQMRSDLTHVALAVGARPGDAPERHGTSGI